MSSVSPARCSWHGDVPKHRVRMDRNSHDTEESQKSQFPSSMVLSQLYASENASPIPENSRNINASLKRQQRFRNTPMQLRALRGLYNRCSSPSLGAKKKLAALIGRPPHRVNVWFQNQRYRAKQKSKNEKKRFHKREAIWAEPMNTTATRIPLTTSLAYQTAEPEYINAELSTGDDMILQDSAPAPLLSGQSNYYATTTFSSLGSSSFGDRDTTFYTTPSDHDRADYQHCPPISRYHLVPPCSELEGGSPYQAHIIQASPFILDVHSNWQNHSM